MRKLLTASARTPSQRPGGHVQISGKADGIHRMPAEQPTRSDDLSKARE